MLGKNDIMQIAGSHFVLHLLGPDEADVAHGDDADARQSAPLGQEASFLPENLMEDFLDEASDMLDEVEEDYAGRSGWEKPLIIGFVDGVLAASDGSWSSFEDAYFGDADNSAFADVDAAIDEVAEDFEGERPWDEAAKGYVRNAIERAQGESAPPDPAFWGLCAHGFMYGADAAYDLEWKIIVTPANNLMLTDEDSLNEAAMARLEAESGGGGSFFDRVLGMVGIDLGELAEALGVEEDELEGDDGNDEDGDEDRGDDVDDGEDENADDQGIRG